MSGGTGGSKIHDKNRERYVASPLMRDNNTLGEILQTFSMLADVVNLVWLHF